MRLLLDTHVFMWWEGDPGRLSKAAYAQIVDPSNEILLSVASLWEMMIKQQAGKLTWQTSLEAKIVAHAAAGLKLLPVQDRHIYALSGLPLHHKDPFDRVLIAAAICDGLTLVSADSQFIQYSVPILW